MALTVRNGIYYAQKKIPFTNRTVRKSLHTRSRKEAVRLSGYLDSISEISLRQTRSLSYEIQKKHLLRAWTNGLNQLNAPLREREINHSNQEQPSDLVHQLSELIEYYKSGYTLGERMPKGDKTPKLGSLYQQWLSERLKEKTWTEKTAEDIERKFRLFFDWVSPSIAVMDFNHIKAVRIKARLLEKGLAVLTLNKYLQTYSSLFRWLKNHGYIKANPFEGIALKEHRRAQDQRKAFPVTCIGSVINKCAEVGSATYGKEYYKYVPLIAAYSGMRLNEICQLFKRDIQLIDNQWCFVISDDAVGQRLKTPSSKRLVPMHNEIIQSGFFDYIEGNGSDRCFPELTHSRDGYGKNASRWFNERLMKKHFPELDYVFHSFRHTVADVMMKSDVDKGIARAILGHVDDSETFGRYGKGYGVNQLKRAIDSIQYP
ncbi:tyrosine-type recombinase/integrase [Vibrio coralliirubri]|uniref:tyrosine-type recombinase/integrase n=1 Tax=Vibrio coralliirubri TaxID=1516159 RepID=UPI000EFCCB2A|nr:tyrosine-type recombinase/integrase [Vibrio coralliirubri]